MNPLKTFLALVIGSVMMLSSASCSEPKTYDEVEDFAELYEMASYAPPFWMLERDSDDPRFRTVMKEQFQEATKSFQQEVVPKKWNRTIRIKSEHPDPIIQDQIIKTVTALQGIEGLDIELIPDLDPEESDILIISFGLNANKLPGYEKNPSLAIPRDIFSRHIYKPDDGYNEALFSEYRNILKEADYIFRDGRYRPKSGTGNYFEDIWVFREGISFSPANRFQVNGYLRASEDGEIKKAVCSIWLGNMVSTDLFGEVELMDVTLPPDKIVWHSDKYRRQMTTECILRSLGLTGSLPSGVESSLTKNKKPEDIGRYPDLTELDLKLVKRHYKKN